MRVQKAIAFARTTVTAVATDHLRKQIVCGSVQPGETLPELRVGEMLGVSRAPVREALTLLEREGLVEFDRRGTARVCGFDLEDVRELGLMRMVLEPAASRFAAERRPEAGLDAIEENLHALKAVSRLDDVTRLDLDFHRLIFAVRQGYEAAFELSDGPIELPSNWDRLLHENIAQADIDRINNSIKRGAPFGDERWKQLTAAKLKLESTLRPKGRPKKCSGHL
jgi:DNA-binding transcriptional MocR family regulator